MINDPIANLGARWPIMGDPSFDDVEKLVEGLRSDLDIAERGLAALKEREVERLEARLAYLRGEPLAQAHQPCPHCGRTLKSRGFEKHVRACQKRPGVASPAPLAQEPSGPAPVAQEPAQPAQEARSVHTCPDCGREFASIQALRGHRRAHTAAPPAPLLPTAYQCPRCGGTEAAESTKRPGMCRDCSKRLTAEEASIPSDSGACPCGRPFEIDISDPDGRCIKCSGAYDRAVSRNGRAA